MFTKVNAKQEQFLWLVVDGMPGSHAYAEVYGQDRSKAVCEVNASRLLSSAKIRARRQEIIAARAARQPVTVGFLTTELIATAIESRALGQGSAAQACYMGVAKLHGLIVDRVQQDVLVRKPSANPSSPDDMTDAQWLEDFGITTITHESTSETLDPHPKDVEPEGSGEGSGPDSTEQV